MKHRGLMTSLVLLVVIVIAGIFVVRQPDHAVITELDLAGAAGERIHIPSGKPMLVNFWASTCKTCKQEIPHLIELYKELQPYGLDIVGVSMYYDPPIQAMGAARHLGINYPVVFDLDKTIMHAFGMRQPMTPMTYLLDADGKIILRELGMPDMNKLRNTITARLPAMHK